MKLLISVAFAWAIAVPAFADEDMSPDAAAQAEAMYADSCAQCHGRAGRGLASFPSLAGKDESYLSDRLERYRAGERIGPNSPLMIPVAAELSDEEIGNLAAFISTGFR